MISSSAAVIFARVIPETYCAEVVFDPAVVQEFVDVTRNASQMSAKALEYVAIEEVLPLTPNVVQFMSLDQTELGREVAIPSVMMFGCSAAGLDEFLAGGEVTVLYHTPIAFLPQFLPNCHPIR